MRVCIVGHGPSIAAKDYGEWIDNFDIVVRQKRIEKMLEHPHRFGSKVDVIHGSWNQGPFMMDAPQKWVFIDSRYEHLTEFQLDEMRGRYGVLIDKPTCDYWNDIFRSMRTPIAGLPPGMERKPSSDDLGHLHMSSGLHALVYACSFLEPDSVTLLAHDNVKNGAFTWSITRGPEWQKYPDHRWDVEHKLVPLIADHYKVEVTFDE